MHPDSGYKHFMKLYEEYKNKEKTFNEADTRAKFIDVILRECLGWNEKYITREDNTESGRIDYRLIYQDVTLLVIEAKKSGDYFDIPATMSSRRYKLSGSIKTVPNLNKAVEQARQYCDDIGCKYAAIANGYQVVVFSAITIGKSWREGNCYVFHSLDDIKDNLIYFGICWLMNRYLKKVRSSNSLKKGKQK